MGSVPDPYTTGDNDPELEPSRYYRHYLYCDACGSFELDSWIEPADHLAIEKTRQRLGRTALFSTPLVLVPGWLSLGIVPSPVVLVLLATGVSLALAARGFIWKTLWGWDGPVAARWRFFKASLPWLLVFAAAQWLATDFAWPPWMVLLGGMTLLILALVWRGALGSKIEHVGSRCTQCNATYANGSPFFTDLDANPRNLTVADVPRPLGSSPFLTGQSVDYEPPKPGSRLP